MQRKIDARLGKTPTGSARLACPRWWLVSAHRAVPEVYCNYWCYQRCGLTSVRVVVVAVVAVVAAVHRKRLANSRK